MTTKTEPHFTTEHLTQWANAARNRAIHELSYLIEGLQSDLRHLERGHFTASEHALRYRQYCEELHQMQIVVKLIAHVPSKETE